jgi:molybdopterin-dependent oxidoreductase alpha subunit
MGLTQHRNGVDTVQMLANLLLLRGNIGKPGAGICPVRGHSNVQGQRTVGITEKPEMAPLDKLAELYKFEPPRRKGLNTVEACEAILEGAVHAFIGLGGNFIRAVPEREAMEDAWRKLRLTVQIATKLNRNHLVHGEISYVLPCIGRTEIDRQAGGPQSVTVEDSTSCVHGSKGLAAPASPHLLSEAKIVAELAKATLGPTRHVDWDGWVADYAKVRDAIAATYPQDFHDLNDRMWTPGGFHRVIAARHRQWKTKTGKANFMTPESLAEDPDMPEDREGILRLITLRSNDQFNTTIYGYNDRFRGIYGTRMVLLMNRGDMDRLALVEGDLVRIVTEADDRRRAIDGFRVTAYDIPEGCVGGYYPECNALVPLWHHAKKSKVPAAKSIPVRVYKTAPAADAERPDSSNNVGAVMKLRPKWTDIAADAGQDIRAGLAVSAQLASRAIVKRPLRTVAVALALGFLTGIVTRRRGARD